jgi:hypothetical protein
MRKSLLDMVQLILSAMDSDEVNSIADTIEATQVAKVIESTYYDIITDIRMPEHSTAFQLIASGSSTKPCVMTVPSNVVKVDEIRYNHKTSDEDFPNYKVLQYISFYEFMEHQQVYRNDTTGVSSMVVSFNSEDYTFIYRSDRMPQYYTTCDDNTILFDSYDSDEDNTLQKSKTMCLGSVYPAWSMTDTFYPDIDPTQFSLLINRAKTRAFKELKQQDNLESAGEARRQKIAVQKRKRKTPDKAEVFKQVRFGRK